MTVFPVLEQMGVALNSTVSGTGFTVQTMAQFGYSVVFFAAAMAVAFRPDKLTDRLGKMCIRDSPGCLYLTSSRSR